MRHLQGLVEDEVRYVCSVIPHRDIIDYFQCNPKEFTKIQKGFRASSITLLDVGNLLYRHRNRTFVSSFIEKQINDWLFDIQEHVTKCIKRGDTKDSAYIYTLPISYFASRVRLYFKLIEEQHSDEYFAILESAITATKEMTEKQDEIQTDLKEKESYINQLITEINVTTAELDSEKTTLHECKVEIMTLKRKIADLENQKCAIENYVQRVTELESEIREKNEMIHHLNADLSDAKDLHLKLEVQIRADVEKENSKKGKKPNTQMCPKDMTEFLDFLGYNLESAGISSKSEFFSLLKEHLRCILFQGIPILISRVVGITLMKCISNALLGTPDVMSLTFENNISIQAIDDFLSKNARIVYLDNFIGNINETELLPLFDKHKNKIIFLTIAYDRTLNYVSNEFLKYCHYLNLNRIEALSVDSKISEDPSTFEEIEVVGPRPNSDLRYSLLFKEILSELGIAISLAGIKAANISSEQDFCRYLAFDILPYCVDVIKILPFCTSERLIKYAGDTGRCQHKTLFKGWFSR